MYDAHIIFRVHRAVRAIEAVSGMKDLDLISRSILIFLGDAEAAQKALKVTDITKRTEFGTAPTVYSRLEKLQKLGWISCIPDQIDGRVRRVRLTPLAKRTFKMMSKETHSLLARDAKASPKNI